MEKAACGTCIHFFPHYTRAGRDYILTVYGHCCHPRIKPRAAAPACRHYIEKKERDEI